MQSSLIVIIIDPDDELIDPHSPLKLIRIHQFVASLETRKYANPFRKIDVYCCWKVLWQVLQGNREITREDANTTLLSKC